MSFLGELKRRNVLRVAAANALVCWILIESGSVLLPTFGVPEWFFKIYVIIIGAGFVVSLIIAWVFEITPEGVKLESDVDRSTYEPPKRGKLNVVIIGLLAMALGVSVTFNITGLRDRSTDISQTARALDSIAVLPFASLSADPDNQFFTDGIHADLLTRLADNTELRVISGTSVAEYRGSKKNVREIGEELNVATIVEGAVQRAGEQVRISVQLIDTGSDEPIWSNTFDRQMTMRNVFDIQSEISMQIAGSLRDALTPEQEKRLTAIPTMNVDAYASYVTGRNNLYLRRFESLLTARQEFEEAIAIDPTYAQAYAGLAEAVMVLQINHKALIPGEAIAIAEQAIEKALEYDPDLSEAYAVRGLIEYQRWKPTRSGSGNMLAAAAFEKAIQLNPNLSNAYVWYGSLRESENDNEQAIAFMQKAITIDPLGRIPYVNLPGMHAANGNLERAVTIWLKAIELFEDWPTPIQNLAEHLVKMGRLDEALAWEMLALSKTNDPMAAANMVGIQQAFGQTEYVERFMDDFPEDHALYPLGIAFRHFMHGEFAETIETIENLPDRDAFPPEMMHSLLAASSVMLKDYDKAHEYLLKANPLLARDANDVVSRQNIGAAVMLAFVSQQRGDVVAADRLLKNATWVVDDMPRLGWWGHGIRDVQILTLQGRKELALDRLSDALDAGFVSLAPWDSWHIDDDPIIEPLREHPRYQALRREMDERIDAMRENAAAAEASGDWETLRSRIQI